MYTAVGVHVFAGGFSYGVSKQHKVACQLETHNFALDTASQVFGVETFNHKKADWPHINADWCFGNPRCTGFSTITAGSRLRWPDSSLIRASADLNPPIRDTNESTRTSTLESNELSHSSDNGWSLSTDSVVSLTFAVLLLDARSLLLVSGIQS